MRDDRIVWQGMHCNYRHTSYQSLQTLLSRRQIRSLSKVMRSKLSPTIYRVCEPDWLPSSGKCRWRSEKADILELWEFFNFSLATTPHYVSWIARIVSLCNKMLWWMRSSWHFNMRASPGPPTSVELKAIYVSRNFSDDVHYLLTLKIKIQITQGEQQHP